MKFTLGLDLGQAHDPTAIAIADRVVPTQALQFEGGILVPPSVAVPPEIHLRHLERIKLGTPYPKIVEYVGELLRRSPLLGATELVVDATGVGRPVVDMFLGAGLDLIAVTITGGNLATQDGNNWRVPKRDLVVGLQVLLQEKRLRFAGALPDRDTLVRELLSFKVKIDPVTAHDAYNARDGAHDDLVLAAALACWRAQMETGWVV